MEKEGINEQVLYCIREAAGSDKVVAEFIINLITDESEQPGQWHWKDYYYKKVTEYSKKWRG